MSKDKIATIKRVRELTSASLREAKDAVDAAEGDLTRALEILGWSEADANEHSFTANVKRYGSGFVVLAAAGYPFGEGTTVRLWLENNAINVADSKSGITVRLAFGEIAVVDVGGPGMIQSGGGYSGGGFGVAGFVLGVSAAAALNKLTTSYAVRTLLRVSTRNGELNLVTDEILPGDLELDLAPVRVGMRAARVAVHSGDDVVDRLERLAALRDRGVLTEEEFQSQKQRILGEA